MLRVMKNSGQVTSRANDGAKGTRGRLDFVCNANDDGSFAIEFNDVGNYGKNRWDARCIISKDELKAAVKNLSSVLNGSAQTSLEPFVEPATTEETGNQEDIAAASQPAPAKRNKKK